MALPNAIGIGFKMPELIVESIIRDGLQNVNADPSIIDYVFNELTRTYNQQKYGQAEILRIKALLAKPLAIVYSYVEVDAKSPCYSIMLGADDEDKKRAQLADFYEYITEPITDPVALAALIKVNNMIVTGYQGSTGFVSVDDSIDLTPAYPGLNFVDSVGNTFTLTGGIDNTLGHKGFFIATGASVDFHLPNCQLVSVLNFNEYEVRGLTSDIKLVIGVHAKDVLITKYLYVLLKYFIFSRKTDLISRGIYVSSYNGSDFLRDGQYQGDMVYTRFLTVTGKIDDTWRADQIQLFDDVVVQPTPINNYDSDDTGGPDDDPDDPNDTEGDSDVD